MKRQPPNKSPSPSLRSNSSLQAKALENARRRNQDSPQAGAPARTTPTTVARRSTKPLIPVDSQGQMVPGTYKTKIGEIKVKKIEPAKNYDVLSFARAMNDDLGPRVQQLFAPELEAAEDAIKSGLYISWRPKLPPYDQQDCQRVCSTSRCFCGHLLHQHQKFTGVEHVLKCNELGCRCKEFRFVASRPEEVGEYWLRRRTNFDPKTYRMKCRCKHTHEEHHVEFDRCRVGGCGCSFFYSASVCAACDQHWHQHRTVLETAKERKDCGRPIGEDWLPFSEVSTLKNMVLTGVDDGGELVAISNQPPPPAVCDNNTPFPAPRGATKPGFRPIHD